MKFIKSILLLLCCGTFLVQCDKRDAEVVQFNDKYTVKKPTKGKRETPPKVDLLNLYARFDNLEFSTGVLLRDGEMGRVVANTPEVTVPISTSFPPSVDAILNLSIDEETGKNSGKNLLPTNAVRLPESVTLTKDTQTISANISFDAEIIKTLEVGTYYFYLRLGANDTEVKFKEGHSLALITVSVKHSRLPNGNNLNLFSGSVLGMSQVSPNSFAWSSASASNHLYKLSDNSSSYNWWVSVGYGYDLVARFHEAKTLKVVYIECGSRNKGLGSVKVEVTDDSGVWIEQGVFTATGYNDYIMLSFPQPVEVSGIRFSEFQTLQGATTSSIDIHEIKFFQ